MALWQRHLSDAADRWHEGVEQSGEQYREGLADALGVDPEDVPDDAVENWKEGVAETDPDEFAGAVAEGGADWFAGLYENATGSEPPSEVTDLAREVEREALARVDDDASDEEITAAVREVVRRRRADPSDE